MLWSWKFSAPRSCRGVGTCGVWGLEGEVGGGPGWMPPQTDGSWREQRQLCPHSGRGEVGIGLVQDEATIRTPPLPPPL